MGLGILSGLLDDKVISVISLFVRYPERKFYLSEVSKLSGVNNTSTFRILNRLVNQDLIKSIVIGKVRIYQMSKGERAISLTQMFKKETPSDGLEIFVDKIKIIPRVKFVVLDSKTPHGAKLIIVSEFSSKERIEKICNEIYDDFKFRIEFVELNVPQFNGLRGLQSFGSGRKILYKRD